MSLDVERDNIPSSSATVSRFGETYWRQGQYDADVAFLPALHAVDTNEYRELADNLPTLCWIADADGYITWYNRRWHEYCGTTSGQMEGWGWKSVHDPAVLPEVMQAWTKSIASGAPFEMVFPLKGADGVFRPFLTRIVPLRNAEGEVRRWIGNNIDISRQADVERQLREAQDDLQAANRALAERESFLSSVLAASTDCIKVLELDGTLSFMSEGGQKVMEVSDFNAILGCPWPDFLGDGGSGIARQAIDAAREGRSTHFETGADTMAGTPKWWSVSVSPIVEANGRVARILSVSRDHTALYRGREQQQLLNTELAHRLKNTMSVTQAIANQTFGAVAERETIATFNARLSALARAHDVLTAQSWSAAGIGDVAAQVLSTFGVERFQIEGPEVMIGARAALALSLLLHELATNAIKYGALSVDAGRVGLNWTIGAGKLLHMVWNERGGPPAVESDRRGFGSRIIRMGLTGSGGTVAEYGERGLTLTIEAPVDQLQQV